MSTVVSAFADAQAVTRASTVLAAVQETVPSATLGDAYAGAVRVGLNRLASSGRTYTADDYEPQEDPGASALLIDVEDDDVDRADAIAAALSVTREVVVSAAVCTGLAMLSGVDAVIEGPFEP